MTNKSIEIKPGMGVYQVFKHLKYKSWYAIAEFIDNSLQSFISKDGKFGETRNTCKINIIYDPNEDYLSIEDNAYGIADNEHERAFTAGVPPSDTSGLSEFGMGMKSAGLWFSPYWSVKTQSIDSDLEYEYIFDLEKVVESNGVIEPLIGNKKERRGYTKIELNSLNTKLRANTLNKIKIHLSSIYRCFIRTNELEITFNGEVLNFNGPEILKSKKAWKDCDDEKIYEWKKTISFSMSNQAKVSGFVAIRKKGSLSQAGLSLFRRKRLIEGSDEDKYKPKEIFKEVNSFMSQRIFGELFLEGFEVSHTKDAFNFGEYEEEFLEKLEISMNSDPLPIIKQSIAYRVDESSSKTVKKIVGLAKTGTQNLENKIKNTATEIKEDSQPKTIIGKIVDNFSDDKENFNSIESKSISNSVENQKYSKELEDNSKQSFKLSGILWNINYGITDIKGSGLYKLEYNDEASKRPDSKTKNISILIYKDHPLILKFCNESPQALAVLASMLITLSLSEVLLIAAGARKAHLHRKSFNGLISDIISNME